MPTYILRCPNECGWEGEEEYDNKDDAEEASWRIECPTCKDEAVVIKIH